MVKILTKAQVNQLVKALKDAEATGIKVVEAEDTIKAEWDAKTVFWALEKDSNTWIVRHNDDLFEEA